MLQAARRAERQGWELSWALTGFQVRTLERRGQTVVGAAPAEIHSGLAAIGRRLTWEWLDQAGAPGREVLDADREAPAQGGR